MVLRTGFRNLDRKLKLSLLFYFFVEEPESTCDNPAAQWAEAISLIKETSKVFVATRDTKACLELLGKLLELPFF